MVGNSNVYDEFFDENSYLKYTPILAGIKEDIVLESYAENVLYDFLLETDGLCLYNDDEGYYLADVRDGSFLGIHYTDLVDKEYYLKDELENPYEDALTIAKNIAMQQIDVDEYRIEESVYQFDSSEEGVAPVKLYTFRFVKFVGEFRSSNWVYIQVTSKGDLRTIGMRNLECFHEIDAK